MNETGHPDFDTYRIVAATTNGKGIVQRNIDSRMAELPLDYFKIEGGFTVPRSGKVAIILNMADWRSKREVLDFG